MKAVRELPDGSLLIHEYEEMTPQSRPQDPQRNGRALRFEPAEEGWEGCLQVLVVSDREGRSCAFEAEPGLPCPQSHDADGNDLSYEVLEYGGEYDDDMALLIGVTDRDGHSGLYRPMMEGGRVVHNKGFSLVPVDDVR
jgi:hypothetical protein